MKLFIPFQIVVFFLGILTAANLVAALKMAIYPEGNESCHRVSILLAINFVVVFMTVLSIGFAF